MNAFADARKASSDTASADQEALFLALDGFEGPLAVLLELARSQKVDLAHISMSALADQYLVFIAEASARDMDVAADHLVMASWLVQLKSRLLLPQPKAPEGPTPDEIAEALKGRLLRLAETRAAAARLAALPRLDREVFLNGAPTEWSITREPVWQVKLYDLLAAYCAQRAKQVGRRHSVKRRPAYALEDARRRLEGMLGDLFEWADINALTPPRDPGPEAPPMESYRASLFGAALELVKEQRAEIRQSAAFGPLFVRARVGDS